MRNAKAFTLTELVAVIVILLLIAALLFPVFTAPPHEKSKQISCLSNLKQLGLAMFQYIEDSDNRLPPRQSRSPNVTWRAEINPYVKSTGLFQCPTDPAAKWPDIEHDGFPRSYAVNSSTGGKDNIGGPFDDTHPALSIAKISSPATTITIVESTSAFNDFNPLFPSAFAQPSRDGWRTGHLFCGHDSNTNVLFVDGHAKIEKPLATFAVNPIGWNADPANGHGAAPNSLRINGWTIDGSPFSPADQATATSTLQYSVSMGKDK